MKKTLATFIIALLVLSASMPAIQAMNVQSALSFGVSVTPSNSQVNKGESVTLAVSVNNLDVGDKGINTFLATMDYDKNVFNTVSATDIKSASGWDTPVYNVNNGKMLTTAGSFVKTDSKVLEVTLTAKSTAQVGSTTVTFRGIEASNSDEDITAANASYSLSITEKAQQPDDSQGGTTGGDNQGGGTTGGDSTGGEGNQGGTTVVTKPKVTTNYETTANGVKVILTSDKELKPMAGWTLSADKKQLTKVYTQSFNETIKVVDADGNESEAITIKQDIKTPTITVDSTKPTATVKYSKANNKVTVTITASEEVQPLSGWTLSADKKTLTRVFTAKQTEKITLTDLAGNKSLELSVNVDPATVTGEAGTATDTNNNNNNNTNNNNNNSTSKDKLPQAGAEAYIIPAIIVISILGTFTFVKYRSMKY